MERPRDYESSRVYLVSTPFEFSAELVRWLCEQRHIAYEEPAFPGEQDLGNATLRIETPDGAPSGIIPVLDLLDRRCRDNERIYGISAPERSATKQWVSDLQETVGRPLGQLWCQQVLATAPRELQALATVGASAWQRFRFNNAFTAWKQQLARLHNLSQLDAAQAVKSVTAAIEKVESQLAENQSPFLHGDAPGTMDLAFAALAAPLLQSVDQRRALYGIGEVPDSLQGLSGEFANRPAGQLVARVVKEMQPARQPRLPKAVYGPTFVEKVLSPSVVRTAARLLVKFAPRLSIGNSLIVSDWAHVTEVLDRDNDFLIAPINRERIEAVSGPFILGMDRSPQLIRQRELVYAALRDADKSLFMTVLSCESNRLLEDALSAGGQLDVVNGYARLVACRTAAALFGIHGPTEQDLLRVLRAIFHETFLNQSSDQTVRKIGNAAGAEFGEWIEKEQQARLQKGEWGTDVLGRLMASSSGDQTAARWMLAGLQVGAVDTTATVVANIITEVLSDRRLQHSMEQDVDDPRLFAGWCWEALRRRPHNAGMLRQAGVGASLRGQPVAEGTKVLLLTVGAMHDPVAYEHPMQMNPRRPLENYLHFGRGLHTCAGRDFNAIQIPALVRALIQRKVSGRPLPRTRGPFPDELKVTIQRPD